MELRVFEYHETTGWAVYLVGVNVREFESVCKLLKRELATPRRLSRGAVRGHGNLNAQMHQIGDAHLTFFPGKKWLHFTLKGEREKAYMCLNSVFADLGVTLRSPENVKK